MYRYGPWLGFGWGWILGCALLIALVLFVVWAALRFARPAPGGGASPGSPVPLQILQERFARGEITKEEYEEARRILGYKP